MEKIKTDALETLYQRTLSLFPDTSLDDFMEEIKNSGYYDFLARINIQDEFSKQLRMIGGKSLLRKKYELYKSGLLRDESKEIIKQIQRSEYFK